MIVLTIRTDKPESEIGLYDDLHQIDYVIWPAHRQLAETLHDRVRNLLERNGQQPANIGGIACYQGPGSFTGLRIGLSVANAYAYSLDVPIVGTTGDAWIRLGIEELMTGTGSRKPVLPEYGAEVHITLPKH